MDLSGGKVFVQKVFSGFSFIGGKRVYLYNLWGKGIVEIDLVVIGSGRRDMVGGFLGEYQGE